MVAINPLTSVLMPVYNAEKYIRAATESILSQTFTDFEFIIINDGSTDGTLDILEEYAQQDRRIRLISRENKGLVATLNEGVGLAKGSLIARMDADDIALPERFQQQIDFLNTHEETVCVGGCAIIIDESGRELTLLKVPANDEKIQEELLKGHASVFHPAVMYRKKSVQQVGLYRKDFYPAEDLDLWLRLGEQGNIANLNTTVIKYRFLSNSISGRMAKQQNDAARAATETAWERRGVLGNFEATGECRTDESKQSQYSLVLKFGWWAFNYKNKGTAIHYGLKAIKLQPLDKNSWVLLICAIFKST